MSLRSIEEPANPRADAPVDAIVAPPRDGNAARRTMYCTVSPIPSDATYGMHLT